MSAGYSGGSYTFFCKRYLSCSQACFGNKIEHDGMITASGAGLFFAGGSYVPSR